MRCTRADRRSPSSFLRKGSGACFHVFYDKENNRSYFLVGKLVSGVLAVLLSLVLAPKVLPQKT